MKEKIQRMEEKLDVWGEKLEKKVIRYPSDLVTGIVFLVLAIVILLIMPQQVQISEKDVVNGRAFPTLLMEVKALLIMAILIVTYLLANWTGLFVIGGVFCCLAFLVYFRCKKPSYYIITLTLAVAIWAAFRFVLGVGF